MNRPLSGRIVQRAIALAAVLFGVVTIVAGTRILGGSDPGYVVFLPLLIYNTAMGFAYLGVGVVAWRHLDHGRNGATAVFLLNLLVLAGIGALHLSGGAVATQSLGAMAFRTLVWLGLFTGLWWLSRRARGAQSRVQ